VTVDQCPPLPPSFVELRLTVNDSPRVIESEDEENPDSEGSGSSFAACPIPMDNWISSNNTMDPTIKILFRVFF